jgi:hypothetical protein
VAQDEIVVKLETGHEQRIPLRDVVEARLMVEMGRGERQSERVTG